MLQFLQLLPLLEQEALKLQFDLPVFFLLTCKYTTNAKNNTTAMITNTSVVDMSILFMC